MTDLDALLRSVVAHPDDDNPRTIYADCLDDAAGSVECPAGCEVVGSGSTRRVYESAGPESRWVVCDRCTGTGRVSNLAGERAAFVRVGVELARMPRLVPANILCHQVEWEHFAGRLSDSAGKVRFEPPAPGASSGVGVLHYERPNPDRKPLEARERALFDAHKCAWFGDRWAVLCLDGEQEDAEGNFPDLTTAVVSRGFVSELRLPLAAFLAGECGACDGTGYRDRVVARCYVCAGTGRNPGLDLAAVFGAHPVTAVVLTDREPIGTHLSGGYRPPSWVPHDRSWAGRNRLPEDLLEAVRVCNPHQFETPGGHGSWLGYETEAAALLALSDACVRLGREAAGLPAR